MAICLVLLRGLTEPHGKHSFGYPGYGLWAMKRG